MTGENALPAGGFSSWLNRTRCALIRESGTDVPCDECTACCTSSYFIHVRPEEKAALARIPRKLLFPAPGPPRGTMLLGYDEHGRCPLFIDGKCSIYEDRPLACRSYDCRLFAAAGIAAGGDDKAAINERVHRWKFSYPDPVDRDRHTAVQAAARFLRDRADLFPAGAIPDNATQLALLALKVHGVFLKAVKTGEEAPDTEIAEAVMEAMRHTP